MAKTAAIEFFWSVSKAGYQVMDVEDGRVRLAGMPMPGGKILVDPTPHEVASLVATSYDPMEVANGSLFRVFADTDPTEQGILDFANKYGMLGGPHQYMLPLPAGVGSAEHVVYWQVEILSMAYAVKMWDMARAGNAGELVQHVKWDDSGAITFPQALAAFTIPREVSVHLQRGDLVKPALHYVGNTISTQLSYELRPKAWLQWVDNWTRLELQVVPDSLIGEMWLQFAHAVDGNKDYRRCLQCNGWFVVDPISTRGDRQYCSDGCRSKAYRVRIDEARRLHSEGVPLEEIAARLESEPKTVKGWIERSRERRGQR